MGRAHRMDAASTPGWVLAAFLSGVAALAFAGPAHAAPAKVDAALAAARAPASQLHVERAVPLPGGGTVYRYSQRVGGIPVLGGDVVVNDAPGRAPAVVADATRGRLTASRAPRIGRSQAIAAALGSTGATALRAPATAGLAVDPAGGGMLVWRVLAPSSAPLADFEVLVDARSGRVVATHDLLRYRSGQARLFNPNAVTENGSYSGLMSDFADADTPLLTSLREQVTLPRLADGQHCLRGRWANAKLGNPSKPSTPPKKVCKQSLRWNGVTRSKDRFEALMSYFHIDRTQKYIQSLGFSDRTGNGAGDRRQLAIADSFGQDNSFYSPGSQRIEFGIGGVDDAEDGDVIVHEYGHAIQDDQSPDFLSSNGTEPGGLSEGSGDYLAAVMSAQAGTTNEEDVCIFDWDGISYSEDIPPCGRRADSDMTLPQARSLSGPCFFLGFGVDIHCVGTVWSSALWDLRQQLGGSTVDRLYLASQFMYTRTERFSDAAEALLAADDDMFGGSHGNQICAEMAGDRDITGIAGC